MVYSCDGHGVKPDPEKTKEIERLKIPSCVQELQSFLGMVQYLSPLIPNLSNKIAPLCELLSEYMWTSSHTQAFSLIKDTIASAVTLNYFNTQHKTKVQVDASKYGLGAGLIQYDPSNPEK